MTIPGRRFYFYVGVASAICTFTVIWIRAITNAPSALVSHILGSAPSFFGLLALLMLLLAVIKPKTASTLWISVIVISAGTLAHEAHQFRTVRVFDYFDVIAIACGAAAFHLIHVVYETMNRDRDSNRGASTRSNPLRSARPTSSRLDRNQ